MWFPLNSSNKKFEIERLPVIRGGYVDFSKFSYEEVIICQAEDDFFKAVILKTRRLNDLSKIQRLIFILAIRGKGVAGAKNHNQLTIPVKISTCETFDINIKINGKVDSDTMTMRRFFALIHKHNFLLGKKYLSPLIQQLDASKMSESFQLILPLLGPGFNFHSELLFGFNFGAVKPEYGNDSLLGHKLYWLGLMVLDYLSLYNFEYKERRFPFKEKWAYDSGEFYARGAHQGFYTMAGMKRTGSLDQPFKIEYRYFIEDNLKKMIVNPSKWQKISLAEKK